MLFKAINKECKYSFTTTRYWKIAPTVLKFRVTATKLLKALQSAAEAPAKTPGFSDASTGALWGPPHVAALQRL